MEIKYVTNNDVSLSKINCGETFEINDELFMKTDDISYIDSSEKIYEWNCVKLADGENCFIPLSATVKKVKSSVMVEE